MTDQQMANYTAPQENIHQSSFAVDLAIADNQ